MKTIESILSYKIKKLNQLDEQLETLGKELGLLDSEGIYNPSEREFLSEATQLKLQHPNTKADMIKGLQYIKMIIERRFMVHEIEEIKDFERECREG